MTSRTALMAGVVLSFALAPLLARSLQGQSPPSADCSYAACALRVRYGFRGSSLVRGETELRVQGLNWWVRNTDVTFQGVPEAQELAASFRRRHNTGFVLMTVGFGLFFSSVYGGWADDSDGGLAIGAGGLVLSLAGAVTMQSGLDHLSRAVWVYNATLSR